MRAAILSVLLAGLPVAAQPPADLLATLTKLERDSWEAMKRQDAGFFKTFMADDFRGVFADGQAVTKKDFVEALAAYKLTAYDMGGPTLLPVGADAALIMYTVGYEGTFQGEKVKVVGARASSLYAKRGGRWVELFYQETAAKK